MRNYFWVLIIVAGLILVACGADVTLAPSPTPTARPTPTLAIAPTDTPAPAPTVTSATAPPTPPAAATPVSSPTLRGPAPTPTIVAAAASPNPTTAALPAPTAIAPESTTAPSPTETPAPTPTATSIPTLTATPAPTATPTPIPTPIPEPTAIPTPIPEPTPTSTIHKVDATEEITFSPANITIEAGDTVEWTVTGSIHTTTSGSPNAQTALWDTEFLKPGESFSRTFNQVGEFPYFCRVQGSFMSGTITVVESMEGQPSSPPAASSPETTDPAPGSGGYEY